MKFDLLLFGWGLPPFVWFWFGLWIVWQWTWSTMITRLPQSRWQVLATIERYTPFDSSSSHWVGELAIHLLFIRAMLQCSWGQGAKTNFACEWMDDGPVIACLLGPSWHRMRPLDSIRWWWQMDLTHCGWRARPAVGPPCWQISKSKPALPHSLDSTRMVASIIYNVYSQCAV